ncbi:hypothetical protein ACHAXA_002821 [Cyclostephanos tholiformis]|uniref:Integral membrane protein n=1 Tax=Cyclostephanos tholiformis TaxID=382380 RepID=A0ABD3RZN8_9STRA
MAHLITSHDPYHIHKILGLLVLINYIYRYYLVFTTGSAFPNQRSISFFAICSVVLHGLLSWSSLLLPLPKTRNFNSPMIWPEFRLHSILFATRHMLCTVVSLANLWPNDDNDHGDILKMIKDGVARAIIIMGTVHIASLITTHYGDFDKRTTNSMPYPPQITHSQQSIIKKWYSLSQFGATISCLMNDASINFAPLLAIQMAPLLMTLVRKGKISTWTYHRVYSLSLFLGYLLVCIRLLLLFKPGYHGNYNVNKEYIGDDGGSVRRVAYTIRAAILYNTLIVPMKLRNIASAKMVWLMVILFASIVYPLLAALLASFHTTRDDNEKEAGQVITAFEEMLRKVILFAIVRTVAKQAFVYAPLFGVTLKNVDMLGIMKASSKRRKTGYDCDRNSTVQSE